MEEGVIVDPSEIISFKILGTFDWRGKMMCHLTRGFERTIDRRF